MRVRSSVSLAHAAVVAAALALSACGSTATSTTAPSQVPRCGISLSTAQMNVPSTGGTGTLSVAATRECVWSAEVDGAWLTIRSGASGQGEGTVEFAAAPNPDPRTRTGGVIVNGTRAQVTQAAAECVISLAETAADFPSAGGTGRIEVRASSTLCTWTAAADAPWIEITSGASGSGNGAVTIAVAATTGPPRAGTVTVAGQRFSVTQSQGCTYAIDRDAQQVPSSGATGSVTVTTGPACPWTAAANVPWITINPASGAGPGPVTFSVAPTDGPQRTGTAVIAGRLFTVTQSPGCSFDVLPNAHAFGAAGGTGTVTITTAPGCAWSASSTVPWIAFQGTTSGQGPANLPFTVAPTTGPARTAVLNVAGRTVTVSQSQGCTYAIAPESQSLPPAGGTGTVAVTTGEGCAWTAASNVPWATITAGASGTGSGEVRFSVAATTGPARSGTLTIAGRTFTIGQGEGCAFTLSPTSADVGNAGGQRTFEVQTAAGCAWTATTSTPWITIDSGASGSGTGTVRFTVGANTGPGRSGSIIAGGQTFTVTQGQGCTYAIAPEQFDVPASGGARRATVTAPAGCAWTASANVPWLTIASGGSGSGDGDVNYAVAPNTGPARSGTLTIAGRTHTVNQAAGCTFAIAPSQASVPAEGGATDVAVTAPGGCAWTAASNVPWITPSAGGGSGTGTVRLTVAPNPGAARSGTVTIAGATFTVDQASGCAFTVAPENVAAGAGGGNAQVDVTTSAGCAWTATANDAWLTITSGASGTGPGPVAFTIAANTGPARTGSLVVAGRTVTVSQESGCTFTLSPPDRGFPAAGGTASVNVDTSDGCAWTAVSGVSWITITAGASGTGDGTVQFAVEANATGAPRVGTIAIGNQTFTLTQQ